MAMYIKWDSIGISMGLTGKTKHFLGISCWNFSWDFS